MKGEYKSCFNKVTIKMNLKRELRKPRKDLRKNKILVIFFKPKLARPSKRQCVLLNGRRFLTRLVIVFLLMQRRPLQIILSFFSYLCMYVHPFKHLARCELRGDCFMYFFGAFPKENISLSVIINFDANFSGKIFF